MSNVKGINVFHSNRLMFTATIKVSGNALNTFDVHCSVLQPNYLCIYFWIKYYLDRSSIHTLRPERGTNS